jgi:outer membrane protein assembly factor BamB
MKSVLRSRSIGLVCFLAALPAMLPAANSNWPVWRGPTGAGVAPNAQPPLTWSDEQNIKWKTKVPGLGFSTPIVWKDRIFLLTAVPADGTPGANKAHEFTVLALDRATGKIVWQKIARSETPHEGHHPTSTFASASPVTDGERLWVPFGSRGFYCYDLQGNLLWEKDLGDMKTRMAFGEGSSPAVAGDNLIITWDHEEKSFIVALNKKTGAEVWRKDRNERSSWSTPLIVEVDGKLQVIVAASRATRSYDVATGEIVWEARGLTGNVIPHPIVGHGLVYVMSGFQGHSIQAIKLSSKGDVSDTDNIVWHVRKSAPYAPSAALSGDRLYMSKSNDAYLSCLNALTGEPHYQDQPLPGLRGIYASPVVANGHLYVVGREGTVMVLKDAAKFEVVATNKLNDRIDASPVALDKELFLRGHEFLYCIAEG